MGKNKRVHCKAERVKKKEKENTNSVNTTEIKPLTDVKILTVRNTDGMLKST